MIIAEDGSCQMKGAIWSLPKLGQFTNDIIALEKVADIDTTQYGNDLKCIAYHPTDGSKAVAVVDNHFVLYDLANDTVKVTF